VSAFYNENDAYPAAWLRNLVDAGLIAPDTVDERSVADLDGSDLDGFTQAHFFAGIGGWSHALRLAGWPDDAPAWTGSCPCQPFSAAGKRGGHRDERHLWPAWFRLICERRPPVVFGEQVASCDGLAWLAAVQADMEAEGYAFGALDLCAAGVGAPHIRQRIFFVADAAGTGATRFREHGGPTEAGQDDATGSGLGFWSACDWLPCRDGKARPVEPGSFPLAHGVPARVGRLRAYGNAIVPQVAAEFVRAFMDGR
jgi:DNA (cytosine-5)-methyltransferase 1